MLHVLWCVVYFVNLGNFIDIQLCNSVRLSHWIKGYLFYLLTYECIKNWLNAANHPRLYLDLGIFRRILPHWSDRAFFDNLTHISWKTDQILYENVTMDVSMNEEVPTAFYKLSVSEIRMGTADSPWRRSALSECRFICSYAQLWPTAVCQPSTNCANIGPTFCLRANLRWPNVGCKGWPNDKIMVGPALGHRQIVIWVSFSQCLP